MAVADKKKVISMIAFTSIFLVLLPLFLSEHLNYTLLSGWMQMVLLSMNQQSLTLCSLYTPIYVETN